jgi:hypothetical protein
MMLTLFLTVSLFNLNNLGAQSYLFYNPVTTIGYDAVLHNPANLALKENSDYSIRLASLNLFALNNILTFDSYNQYFTSDSPMNDQDRTELFQKVPNNGLSFDGGLNIGALDFSFRNFGFAFRRFDLLNLNLSKELIDLALFGNELGRTYDFSNLSYDYLAYYSFNFAFALPVIKKKKHFATIGIGLKYLLGEDVRLTENISGNLYSNKYYLQGNITWQRKIATDGNGWAADLGGTYEFKNYRFSLALLNLTSGILWNRKTQINIKNAMLDSFSVYRAIKSDSLDMVYQTQDSFYPIESFKTKLPTYLTFGTGWKIDSNGSILSIIYEQNLVKTKFLILTPKFTLNYEWNLLQFIIINPSISLGGSEGVAFALGLGKNIRRFLIGLSLQSIQNPIINHAKGIKFGLSIGITPP